MRKLALLPLLALAVGCSDTVTSPDDLGVAFKKDQGKGPKAEYGFAYDTEGDHALGSDCWKMSPVTTYGRTFWCVSPDADSDPPADPTFVFQVLKDGEPGVASGEITFERCEAVRSGTKYEVGTVMDWTYCGVLLKKYRRFFGGVYYKTVTVAGGLAQVTLDDFWTAPAKELAVWGMRWWYDQGDGEKPEAEIKFWDLAHEGHVHPPDN